MSVGVVWLWLCVCGCVSMCGCMHVVFASVSWINYIPVTWDTQFMLHVFGNFNWGVELFHWHWGLEVYLLINPLYWSGGLPITHDQDSWVSVCVGVCMCVGVSVWVWVYVNVCMCVCMYVLVVSVSWTNSHTSYMRYTNMLHVFGNVNWGVELFHWHWGLEVDLLINPLYFWWFTNYLWPRYA